jgi:hypothetical protein
VADTPSNEAAVLSEARISFRDVVAAVPFNGRSVESRVVTVPPSAWSRVVAFPPSSGTTLVEVWSDPRETSLDSVLLKPFPNPDTVPDVKLLLPKKCSKLLI